MNENILIVDDEKEIADLIEVYLKNDGYTVHKFYNGMDALKCIESQNLDLAILDVMLPDIDGFRILWYLCEHQGKVVSTEELFENIWKEKYLDNNNTVMAHIGRLREKLNEPAKNPKFIKTVWGVGYEIE